MELRLLMLGNDPGLRDMLRAQAQNLGCEFSAVGSVEEAVPSLDWAEAAVVDLADDGLDALARLRVEAPQLQVMAIAVDDGQVPAATEVGAAVVLAEPFSIPELVDGIRQLRPGSADIIDLNGRSADDAPWWATR